MVVLRVGVGASRVEFVSDFSRIGENHARCEFQSCVGGCLANQIAQIEAKPMVN